MRTSVISILLSILLISPLSAAAVTEKLCSVQGSANDRAVLRMGRVDAIASANAEPLQTAEHFGIRYTTNLIVADLAWDCRVAVLNSLLARHRACIVQAHGNEFVSFQIPPTDSYERYKSIEADFIRNECIERISPTFDLRSRRF